MNQTWKIAKKPSFGPDFCTFGPILGQQIFFFQKSGSVSQISWSAIIM